MAPRPASPHSPPHALGPTPRPTPCPLLPSPAQVRATFGCQTYESGLFYSQVADGISGFSQADTYGPTLFDYMRRGMNTPDVFSMCLSESVGALVLGGKVPDTIPAKLWIPYTGGSSYTVQLVDIQIGTRSVGCAASRYVSTIVDSGTTFMYLPPDAYRPIRDHFRLHCPWGACTARTAKGEYPDDYCYSMSLSEVDKLERFSLHMGNGVVIDFGPRQYTYELRRGVWCLGVFDNEHNGAVIGAANMRNHEVIFDREHRRVAFVPSDCGAMHSGRRASMLSGGYSLNGCAAAAKAAAQASPPPPPPPSPSPSPSPSPKPPQRPPPVPPPPPLPPPPLLSPSPLPLPPPPVPPPPVPPPPVPPPPVPPPVSTTPPPPPPVAVAPITAAPPTPSSPAAQSPLATAAGSAAPPGAPPRIQRDIVPVALLGAREREAAEARAESKWKKTLGATADESLH